MKPPQIVENKQVITPEPDIWLRKLILHNGISCSDQQIKQLRMFADLLLGWNRDVNLISRRDEANVWENHILHSLAPVFMFRLRAGARILDLGTGGGLPGIPLKIILPETSFVMIDSTRKKISALQSMIQQLGLSRATAVWGRAEDRKQDPQYQGNFDYVVARGVAPLRDLVMLVERFLADPPLPSGDDQLERSRRQKLPPGSLIAYKGGSLEDEVRRARDLGLAKTVEVFNISFDGSERLPGPEKKLVVVSFSRKD